MELEKLELRRICVVGEGVENLTKVRARASACNRGDQWRPIELVGAHYAPALAAPKSGAARLREAAQLLEGLKPEVQSSGDVQMLKQFVHEAQRASGAITRSDSRLR